MDFKDFSDKNYTVYTNKQLRYHKYSNCNKFFCVKYNDSKIKDMFEEIFNYNNYLYKNFYSLGKRKSDKLSMYEGRRTLFKKFVDIFIKNGLKLSVYSKFLYAITIFNKFLFKEKLENVHNLSNIFNRTFFKNTPVYGVLLCKKHKKKKYVFFFLKKKQRIHVALKWLSISVKYIKDKSLLNRFLFLLFNMHYNKDNSFYSLKKSSIQSKCVSIFKA